MWFGEIKSWNWYFQNTNNAFDVFFVRPRIPAVHFSRRPITHKWYTVYEPGNLIPWNAGPYEKMVDFGENGANTNLPNL